MSMKCMPVGGALLAAGIAGAAWGQAADPTSVEVEGGRHYDAEGVPTFHITDDGVVDFPTYSGFRRYHSECHVCHGPDGLGSTYAPSLVDSVENISYGDFISVVAGGRQNVDASTQNVMPAFGNNPNVYCYIEDIYVYLRARAEGGLPRGRPAKKAPKSDEFAEEEDACMG